MVFLWFSHGNWVIFWTDTSSGEPGGAPDARGSGRNPYAEAQVSWTWKKLACFQDELRKLRGMLCDFMVIIITVIENGDFTKT